MAGRRSFSPEYPFAQNVIAINAARMHYVAEDFSHEIGEKIAQWSDAIG